MSNYIGNQPSAGEFKKLDSIASSFNGSLTQFDLDYNTVNQSVGDATQLIVSLNGIIQEPGAAYTLGIGGGSIVFASAPTSTDTCHIVLLGGVGGTTTPTDGSVTASKLDSALKDYLEETFTANGSQTDFTLTRAVVGTNTLLVTIDGIVQPSSAFTASGTTLTISEVLAANTNVRVVHMGVKAGVYVPANDSITADMLANSINTDIAAGVAALPKAGGTLTGNVNFNDFGELSFGATNDLRIYTEGTGAFIRTNSGDMKIRIATGNILFQGADGSDTMAKFTHNGATELYYDNSKKIETTSTGIDVTGTVTADGLTVDGNASLSGAGTGGRYLALLNETDTYAGRYALQAGGGSSGFGGGLVMYGHSHASNAGDVVAGISSGSGGSFRVNKYGVDGGGDVLKAQENGDISFYAGTTAKFFWDSSAESLGIGTSSPSSILHINNTADAPNGITIQNSSASGSADSYVQFKTNVANVIMGIDATGTDIFKISNSTALGTSDALAIDSSGNVGIGNINPQRQVHIGAADNSNHDAVIVLNNGGATGNRAGIEWRYEGITAPRARLSINASTLELEADINGTKVAAFDGDGLKMTAGKGIKFSAYGSGNILDDYEEGTWTASLHLPPDSLTNTSATAATNRYTKIGNMVTVQGRVVLSGNSSNGSNFRLSGLPFTTSNHTAIAGTMISRYGSNFSFVPYTFSNTTEVHFYEISTSGNWNQVSYNEIAAIDLHFQLTYFAT